MEQFLLWITSSFLRIIGPHLVLLSCVLLAFFSYLYINLIWQTYIGLIYGIFLLINILYHYGHCIFLDNSWKPTLDIDLRNFSDADEWTWCDKCERERPPRTHHCRICQCCVLKMDHHCQWINSGCLSFEICQLT